MDNFHGASCALRHNGKECTCGYVKPLTKQEKEISRLRLESDKAAVIIGSFVKDDEVWKEDIYNLYDSYDEGKAWLKNYKRLNNDNLSSTHEASY